MFTFWGRLKMSSVKYNLKISNCNIFTYINIGAEWESDWRRRQTFSCFSSRNLSSCIFYDVKRADCPQIFFILHSDHGVVDHSSLYSFRTIDHFSTSCGIFLPIDSQKSGAIWNMWVLGLHFHVYNDIFTWQKNLWPGAKIWNEVVFVCVCFF